tara:strand:- start:60 stop:551 length:492 start_codon:yes stop_codon:yes gene_type:complete
MTTINKKHVLATPRQIKGIAQTISRVLEVSKVKISTDLGGLSTAKKTDIINSALNDCGVFLSQHDASLNMNIWTSVNSRESFDYKDKKGNAKTGSRLKVKMAKQFQDSFKTEHNLDLTDKKFLAAIDDPNNAPKTSAQKNAAKMSDLENKIAELEALIASVHK